MEMAPVGQSLTHIKQPMHLAASYFSFPRKRSGIFIFTAGYFSVAGLRKMERKTSAIIFPGLIIGRLSP